MYQVAVLGRPNVGKSTLFNRLTRSRRSIVGDEPGITRDRIYATVEADGRRFTLVDCGGMVPRESELIPSEIFKQAMLAIEQSDLLLLMVDGRTGPLPLDEELLQHLRKTGKEIWLVVNKIDSLVQENLPAAFHSLGVAEMFPVSCEHGIGVIELASRLAARAGEAPIEAESDEIRIAIVGRPNVGKSSIVNLLAGEERVIVTDVPGTTRDAVDTLIRREGRSFRLIDTAGIRRKGKTEAMAEKLSVVMARKSLTQADVAVLILDGVEGPTHLDAAIGGYAFEEGCSVLVAVNKWDLVEDRSEAALRIEGEIGRRMKFLEFAPIDFISARTGQRVVRILDRAVKAAEARRLRIPTARLNEFFEKEVAPFLQSVADSKFKVKYVTQASTAPPTFVLFTSAARLHFSHQRFIVNRLREHFDFFATPIRLRLRSGTSP
jgi:GTP-binding protein